MSKKFWRRGPVSKLLQAPKEVLKHGFFGGEGRGLDTEALLEKLPDLLPTLDPQIEILDRGFPIREGASRVDYLARGSDGELIFIWLKPTLNAESLSKVLPDYDWVQKNQAIWPHLFPEFLRHRNLRMKVWLFSFRIEAELQCFLSYLSGIQLKLFLAKRGQEKAGASWILSPWKERVGHPGSVMSLPSSPSVLSLVPLPGTPEAPKPSGPLISQEELNDLIGLSSGGEVWQPDEVTDPFYVLKSDRD